MKPMTKQLTTAAFILASVTVLSLGIRQVRFSVHRARDVASPPATAYPVSPASAGASGQSSVDTHPDDNAWLEQALDALAEQDYQPSDSDTLDAETYPEHTQASGPEVWADDHSEARTDSGKHGKAVFMAKSFKGDYAKSEGSKGLEKISLGDYEDLYITGKGELWYVSEQPDGSGTKMQVQIDDTTGEMTIVGGGDYARSEGSQGLQRIPLGDYEDLYITGEGELWYVGEQPDGSTAKMQLQTENINDK